jgi:hypothetical protein
LGVCILIDFDEGEKMATQKQIDANRRNSKKSPGPGNTKSTRFNATSHGLLSAGVTELDDAEGYRLLVAELMREKNPVGVLETHRVQCMALDIIRQRRAQRLEAEYITEQLNPPKFETDSKNPLLWKSDIRLVDPGLPANLRLDAVAALVRTHQRYEGFFSNDLSRNERDFERLQQMRHCERLPAPADAGITFRPETEKTSSPALALLECNATTTVTATVLSPLPEANNADEAPSNPVPAESREALEALWQKPRPKPIWRR